MWIPYKTNILVKPSLKNKVIGNNNKYQLFGEVLAVGSEVKDIVVGDTVGFSIWAIKDLEEEALEKNIFLRDDPMFILGIKHKE